MDISESEEQTVAFHERDVADAVDLWRDGLNIVLRGFDPLDGHRIGSDEEPIMITLLMRAWQTLACAFDLALRGYYPQALNLQRTPIEDWLAYWYLRSFPAEHPRFSDLKLTTPSFNDMLQRIEAKHQSDSHIRPWSSVPSSV